MRGTMMRSSLVSLRNNRSNDVKQSGNPLYSAILVPIVAIAAAAGLRRVFVIISWYQPSERVTWHPYGFPLVTAAPQGRRDVLLLVWLSSRDTKHLTKCFHFSLPQDGPARRSQVING